MTIKAIDLRKQIEKNEHIRIAENGFIRFPQSKLGGDFLLNLKLFHKEIFLPFGF
ncbi:hypothetical protein BH18ACI1_BH18ACI1_11680 [soil metagenome]